MPCRAAFALAQQTRFHEKAHCVKVLEDSEDATEIIVAKHGPANGDNCSPLDEIDASFYRPRNTWPGEIGFADDPSEDRELQDASMSKVVLLSPVS